jgi:hypothetical protein
MTVKEIALAAGRRPGVQFTLAGKVYVLREGKADKGFRAD